jgi:hypothetical protein
MPCGPCRRRRALARELSSIATSRCVARGRTLAAVGAWHAVVPRLECGWHAVIPRLECGWHAVVPRRECGCPVASGYVSRVVHQRGARADALRAQGSDRLCPRDRHRCAREAPPIGLGARPSNWQLTECLCGHDSPLALASGARRCLLLSAVVCNAEADLQNSSVFDTEVDATLMVVCIPLGRASSILAHDSRGHIGSL